MQVLIPMAGEGSRFKERYSFPKPLIDIHGRPMIQWVVENLAVHGRHIFLCRKEHVSKYNLRSLFKQLVPDFAIVEVDSLTEGAACTALLADYLIDNDDELIIANSDQFVEFDETYPYMMGTKEATYDGALFTFNAVHPKWSYVRVDNENKVTEVAEKNPISHHANTGVMYWRRGSDFVKYARQMIEKNIRVNNEFYIAPVYNEAIADGKSVTHFPVKKMWGLGDIESLEYFLAHYPA